MSSVNRVLKKRREAHTHSPAESTEQTNEAPAYENRQQNTSMMQQLDTYNPEREQMYEEYGQYGQYNPSNFEFSNSYMPYSLSLYNRYKAPLSCYINPINSDLQYVPQSANTIPRCTSCRAYMNYYNQATRKQFKCFFCGRQNSYQFEYSIDSQGVQIRSPSYLVDGPNNIYNAVPPEHCFIFLVDVSKEAAQCRMLNYMVTVMKDVLARQDLNELLIYFYTFDDTLHDYNFSGEEAERTVMDPTLKAESKPQDSYLGDIRHKLFNLLDSLQDLAQKNTRSNSKFFQILSQVYDSIKHTGGKIFIFQANEVMQGQNFLNQKFKWSTNPQDNNLKVKSVLQTKNKMYFNKFVQPMLVDNISMAFFIFSRNKKNIRVFSDTCKLTNSELFNYRKDNDQEINRFYYQLYHTLSANYFIDTRMEFIISAGWYYTAVYGNLYRLKEYITFKFCHFEESKRVCAVFLPQDGFNPTPYFAIQIVTNYLYQRKHYMSVNTAVIPFTTSLDRLFENMHLQISASTFFKIYLSCLRLEDITVCKNKYIKHAASIWKATTQYYKQNITPELRAMFLSFLGFLKNYHSQVDLINDTSILDRVVAHRNILQSCNYPDCNTTFSPYLFDLTTIGNDRCLPQNFLYPDACELRFSSVKEGVFLMDSGYALYLYLAKQYHPNYCISLFGKQKLVKTDKVDEQTIVNQGNKYSSQVMQLVRVLRESKTYGWVPLHIVRCGQHSQNQKDFYLNFHEQRYDQYKTYKMTYQEFTNMLSKQY